LTQYRDHLAGKVGLRQQLHGLPVLGRPASDLA